MTKDSAITPTRDPRGNSLYTLIPIEETESQNAKYFYHGVFDFFHLEVCSIYTSHDTSCRLHLPTGRRYLTYAYM